MKSSKYNLAYNTRDQLQSVAINAGESKQSTKRQKHYLTDVTIKTNATRNKSNRNGNNNQIAKFIIVI